MRLTGVSRVLRGSAIPQNSLAKVHPALILIIVIIIGVSLLAIRAKLGQPGQ